MPTSSRPSDRPPKDFLRGVAGSAAAKKAWAKLPPSHRREYVVWITTAKKDETRARRLAQAIEMLAGGRHTPMRANDAPAASGAPLAKKLGVKPGSRVVILAAPEGYATRIDGASSRGWGDVVLAFASNSDALARVAPRAVAALADGGILWLAYPKKTSGIATDLSRDHGWDTITRAGWEGVSIVAIDDAWSAVRFRSKGRR